MSLSNSNGFTGLTGKNPECMVRDGKLSSGTRQSAAEKPDEE